MHSSASRSASAQFAGPARDLRQPHESSLHARDVSCRLGELEAALVEAARLGEPVVEERPHPQHRARVVPVDPPLLKLVAAAIRCFVVALAVEESEVRPEQERPGVRPRVLLGIESRDRRIGVCDRTVKIAVVPEPRSRCVGAGRQLVVARVLERVEDEAVAGLPLALEPQVVAQVAQKLRAQVALHQGLVEGLQRSTRRGRFAGIEEVMGERDRSPRLRFVGAGGSRLQRESRQLGRGDRGASLGGVCRGGVELRGDVLVRGIRCEREMPCARLWIVRAVDQQAMGGTPPTRRCGLVDRSREQRVLEVDAAGVVDVDEAGFLRRPECAGRRDGRRRCRRRRRKEKCIAGRPREALDVRAHELLRAGGDRKLAGCVLVSADQLAGDLERVERIAARTLDDLHDGRPRQRAAEARADHFVHRGDGQRCQVEVFPPALRQRRLKGVRPGGICSDRAQHRDVRVVGAAECEVECVRARRIEPLRVVDRDEKRLRAGEPRQRGRGRGRQGARVDAPIDGIVAKERRRERASLRRRQELERLVVHSCEEVDQACERERRLHTRGSGGEHAPSLVGGEVDTCLPEGCLPDSGRAGHGKRHHSVGRPREKRLDRGELTAAADDSWRLIDSHPEHTVRGCPAQRKRSIL